MNLPDEDREAAEVLEVISNVAMDGIAAIERGEFTLIRGREGSRDLLARLNERAAARAVERAAARPSFG